MKNHYDKYIYLSSDKLVPVTSVASLTGALSNGMRNRYAGVVESKDEWSARNRNGREIKEYYVEEVDYVGGVLSILFRNSEEFFVPEYFEKNKKFDTVKIYLLNPLGEKKAVVEFSELEVESCQTTGFSYKSDEILTTDVLFRYKKESHRTL